VNILRTTTFQLTVLYALMLAISTLAIAAFLYWSTIGFLQRQTDSTIEVEITGLRQQYRLVGLAGLSRAVRERVQSGENSEAIYLFANRELEPLAGNLDAWPELVSREDGWYSFTNRSGDERVPARARVLALPEGLLLLVGRNVSDLQRLLNRVGRTLALGFGLLILLSISGGLFMSSQVLRRVENVNQTARRIITGDLSQRVQTRGTRDEFDQLAEILNRMLERIEQLMEGVRHVGDSIAHDLRTPLTRLRHSLEETAGSDNVDTMHANVQDAIDDADRLLATFSALLRIARIEAGSYVRRDQTIELPRLVTDAVELYEAAADEKSIAIDCELTQAAPILGDRDLIFQLIVNLIDNSLKYTPEGGRICIATDVGDATVTLVVEDSGAGIPEAELDKVTRRFYRAAGDGLSAGSGLGLSLVQAVAELHEATVTLQNLQPGLGVTVRFAKAACSS